MSKSLREGLVVGAAWSLVDVLVAFGWNATPASDVVEIAIVPVVLSLVYHLTIGSVAVLRPHPRLDLALALGVTVPAIAFFLRGFGQSAPAHFAAGVLPILFSLPLAVRWRRNSESPSPGIRVAVLVLIYAMASVAACVRGDRVASITTDMLVELGAWTLGTVSGLAIASRLSQHRALGTLAATVVSIAALVFVYASRPPSLEVEESTPTDRASPSPEAQNVLLIVMDTVRADRLDLYGHDRPTFAQTGSYLKQGLIFDRAASSGTFSLTSHGSLFTGVLPSLHGARPIVGGDFSYGRLWSDVPTLAGWLRARGYATLGVSANDIFLTEWTGLQRDFDAFSASSLRGQRFAPFSTVLRRRLVRARLMSRTLPENWTAEQVTDAAVDVVSKSRRPFFLFLNYFDAHEPHVRMGEPPWVPRGRADPLDAYDSEIAFIDAQIARLLRRLETDGILDRTLVIVTSDHGEYFGERGLRGHPSAAYEQSTHIPLALRLPSRVAAGRSGRRTGLHEVFRMVRDVLSGEPLDWMTEPDDTPRVLTEAWARTNPFGRRTPVVDRPEITVVFSGNLKLLHRRAGRSELFDVERDPKEQTNLIDSDDPRIRALLPRMIREADLTEIRKAGPAQPLTEDARERLRALGYLR